MPLKGGPGTRIAFVENKTRFVRGSGTFRVYGVRIIMVLRKIITLLIFMIQWHSNKVERRSVKE